MTLKLLLSQKLNSINLILSNRPGKLSNWIILLESERRSLASRMLKGYCG